MVLAREKERATFLKNTALSRAGAAGVLALSLLSTSCAQASPKHYPQPLTIGQDTWYTTSPRSDETLSIRFDPSYASGSVEAKICYSARRGFAAMYARELQGDPRDGKNGRDLVAEVRSIPTGSATDNGKCWTAYADTFFKPNNQVIVYLNTGTDTGSVFQTMEKFDVRSDSRGNLSVTDLGQQAIDTRTIDTTQANP